jgi:KUP system potassium uptake protein
VLNYAGQAAIVLAGQTTYDNILFRLCPEPLLPLLVVLATVATIIASQSIITGAFSMTRQAVQLGWLPRLRIVQTSAAGYGQIYVPSANWLLMLATLGLTIGFGSSSRLAAAYGIAVSGTMLITTLLLLLAMREVRGWSWLAAAAVASALAIVDAAFLGANLVKVLDGGWVPLALGTLVYCLMVIWRAGASAVQRQRLAQEIRDSDVLAHLTAGHIPRVPGTAAFLARSDVAAPPILLWHLKNNRALREAVFIIDVDTAAVPYVAPGSHVDIHEMAPRVWRAHVKFGFMERPDIPALLWRVHALGYQFDPADVTYYIAHEQIVPREDGQGLPRAVEAIFAFLQRNCAPLTDYFHVPRDKVVEIGREMAI